MMEPGADYWIKKLRMTEHPEGGYFAPSYRSSQNMPPGFFQSSQEKGDRALISSIYYLLKEGQFSAFHRLKSCELWNFIAGSSISIFILDADGSLCEKKLGRHLEKGEELQVAVEPGLWFGAIPRGAFGLVGCTVVPGFDYRDLQFAGRQDLLNSFPSYREIIEMLTRG